jgi:hypothetical protein
MDFLDGKKEKFNNLYIILCMVFNIPLKIVKVKGHMKVVPILAPSFFFK